ncbi:hypothetical protein [Methylobacterium gnaphalii]|uniref:Uncharacterized protein n=1 Tax=Methylobacterium gnaphalii TaxID=1010610 RepID=A0A512JIX1_9HYPH|nr:hypothetical protein [Methylobacterium gnaphalii]GEP09884.1 hypothetical protein MGN01_17290 [Methylobacterium gnaphalii]GJD68339.1 hypothetical protein MMMDOFMJ_1262 [Methylobacterium gnaphalii]GLS49913.1 hypothetical protein GCM10007885_27650 [Methylobacterium gnaphalii]
MPTKAQLRQWEQENLEANRRWLAEEKLRIERQRTLWEMTFPNAAKDRLKEAMLAQAWRLLDAGQGEAADAILEFLPEAETDKLLREFFPELHE